MFSSARLGRFNLHDMRSTLEIAHRFRGRRSIFYIWVAGVAFGRCLKRLDVLKRAARGLNLRDRRSILEMACKFRGRHSFFCIWMCDCVVGAVFGSCLNTGCCRARGSGAKFA